LDIDSGFFINLVIFPCLDEVDGAIQIDDEVDGSIPIDDEVDCIISTGSAISLELSTLVFI